MSFIAAAAPFDGTPSDLKTASLPTQRAANDAAGEGCAWQYTTSASVKLRATNVGFDEGTAEMSSDSDDTICQTSSISTTQTVSTLVDADTSSGPA